MALTKADEKTIRSIFKEEVEPIKTKVQTHDQTIYGSDGKGGIKAEVACHQEEIASLKIFRTQLVTAFFTIVPAIQFAIAIAIEWIKSKFHNG
jgi:hypothetical protein